MVLLVVVLPVPLEHKHHNLNLILFTLTPYGTIPWSSIYHEHKYPSLVSCHGQLKADSQ